MKDELHELYEKYVACLKRREDLAQKHQTAEHARREAEEAYMIADQEVGKAKAAYLAFASDAAGISAGSPF